METKSVGINETLEMFDFADMISVYLIRRLRDGADYGDAMDFFQKITMDPEFKGIMNKGLEGREKIMGELGDITFNEGTQLVERGLTMTKHIVEAIRG